MKGMSKLVGHDTVRVDPTPISSLSCPKNWFSHLTSGDEQQSMAVLQDRILDSVWM